MRNIIRVKELHPVAPEQIPNGGVDEFLPAGAEIEDPPLCI
jgi:hypothetical protein